MIENNLEKILEVEISDAELSFDIATPHTPSMAPFVAEYLEYKRYETVSFEAVAVADIKIIQPRRMRTSLISIPS